MATLAHQQEPSQLQWTVQQECLHIISSRLLHHSGLVT